MQIANQTANAQESMVTGATSEPNAEALAALETLAKDFFLRSVGEWRSQRRYYTLTSEQTQEVESLITVKFLKPDSQELLKLAQKHELAEDFRFSSGALVTWESHYLHSASRKKPNLGSTLFGIKGNCMYRDRGFSTSKPVTAEFLMRDANTLCLKTSYNGCSFEEEIKLVGDLYRTRQTIICREGEEQMIGQYLEKRILSYQI
jgi:hypothetical protein